jgi:hypothetical protein
VKNKYLQKVAATVIAFVACINRLVVKTIKLILCKQKNNEVTSESNKKNFKAYITQELAKECADSCVIYAKKSFNISLDFSEQSIENLEKMVDFLSKNRRGGDQKQINDMSVTLGSYLGEVYIKHHGGEWGKITFEGETYPGIKDQKGACFWPWGRLIKRITDGEENNIWHYYQVMSKD